MMQKSIFLLILFLFGTMHEAKCQEITTKERIVSAFAGKVPSKWGERVKGIKTRLTSDQKVIDELKRIQ